MLRSLRFIHTCALLALLAAGCSGESQLAVVEGNVTLDGQPLTTGIIRFVPVDGQTPSADATITDGKFSAQVPPGEKRITFSAPKVVSQRKMYDTPDSPTVDVVEELLPPKYHAQSKLTLNVESKNEPAQFDLTSK